MSTEPTIHKPHTFWKRSLQKGKFCEAEEEHKDYYKENPGAMYCQIVIKPKVDKVREEFSVLLSDD